MVCVCVTRQKRLHILDTRAAQQCTLASAMALHWRLGCLCSRWTHRTNHNLRPVGTVSVKHRHLGKYWRTAQVESLQTSPPTN